MTQNIDIIIADDERPAREFIKSLLADIGGVTVVGEADNGTDAYDLIRSGNPDLAILDIQMPELSGIDVVRRLRRDQMPVVAFVTAYDEYAVKAFEMNAVDYLLKPVEHTRLAEMLERTAARLELPDWRQQATENVRSAVREYDESTPLERIPIKVKDEIILLPIGEVATVVADGELLHITTDDGRRYNINHRLKDLEMRLDEMQFVRLSRGAIANIAMIDRITPMPGGTFVVSMSNGQELDSSRSQSRVLRSRLLKL